VSGDDFNKLVNGGRMAVGAFAFAAPGRAFAGAGLSDRANPQLPFMTRMFGVRDLVIGWGALSASGGERRRWLQAAIAADVADALAAAAGHRSGYLPTSGAVMLGLTAVTGAALGIAALTTGD
jgi:hypothetical protein